MSLRNKGKNFSDLMVGNRSLVAKIIMKQGECSRSQLSAMTGLTQASITHIVSDLIRLGIVTEGGTSCCEKGRRPILLRIREESYYVIGAKLSRRHFEVGVMDLVGHIIEGKKTIIEEEHSPKSVLAQMHDDIMQYCAKYDKIITIGVSVPGPYLRKYGKIARMTEAFGWEAINLEIELKRDITLPLFIEHDANAGAIAEWWFGGHDSRFLVHILAGEGVGAGIMYEGQLLFGALGVAGEIGHMTIELSGRNCKCASMAHGCLEQYCSSISFLRDVKEALPLHPASSLAKVEKLTVETVFSAASTDAFAREMTRQVGFYLGIGIANVVNIYNPDLIVISDIMSQGGEIMMESILDTVKTRVIPELYETTQIQYSHLPYNTSLFGAAAVAVDHFLANPVAYVKAKQDMTYENTCI